MALSRKLLNSMGLTDEQVETIIENHSETVKGLKDKISELSEQTEGIEEIREKAKKFDAVNIKYEELKKENDETKKQFDEFKNITEKEKTEATKRTLYRDLLKSNDVGDKYIDRIMKLTDLSSITIEDGALKDSDNLSEEIRSEWADFIFKREKTGTDTPKPREGVGGGAMTKADILKIKNTQERQKAWKEFLENEE